MSDDRLAVALFIVLALVLPLSALAARRGRMGEILRSLVAWLVIGGLVGMAYVYRDSLSALGTRIDEQFGIGGQTTSGNTVRINLSGDGHFWARVRVNGVERRMLIDSGATTTAISEATASAAGLPEGGLPAILNTANGQITARQVRADRVALGAIETRGLSVVVSDRFGDTNVLGMNFLSRLRSWRVEGRTLILEPADRTGDGGTAASATDPL